jgi:hypothetical protein
MDLSTGHAAYTLHAQEAQRAEREREFRRVAKERAVAPIEAVATPQRQPRFRFGMIFHGRTRTAQ